MGQKAKALADRFASLHGEMISFIENCSDEDWKKLCPGENWPIGVVTRHMAGIHYSLVDLAKNLVAGVVLPEMSMEAIDALNAQHAEEHADCTKEEILGMLRDNGPSHTEFISGLSDEDLNKTAAFSLTGGEVSPKQLIKITINGCTEHLTNIKGAISKY